MTDNHITEQIKAWRARFYLSQSEAAIFLCISVRALAGMGKRAPVHTARPVPTPSRTLSE